MNILLRYWYNKVLKYFAIILICLLVVFSITQCSEFFLAAGPAATMKDFLIFIGFEFPFFLGIFVPLAYFFAVLISYVALMQGKEALMMRSCGFGRKYWRSTIFFPAILLFVFTLWVSLWLQPTVYGLRKVYFSQTNMVQALKNIPEKRFAPIAYTPWQVYTKENKDGDLSKVFLVIQAPVKGKVASLLVAKKMITKITKSQLNVFNWWQGQWVIGTPLREPFKTIDFSFLSLGMPIAAVSGLHEDLEHIPTKILWKMTASRKRSIAIQWRLLMPCSVWGLAYIAYILLEDNVNPERAYFLVYYGLIIYFTYVLLLMTSHTWYYQGTTPDGIGSWWPHVLLLVTFWSYGRKKGLT
jgi:lipopolysaccharide export system permease protein